MIQSPLYGFEDLSWKIIEGLILLKSRYPKNIHYVLGNHDQGHIDGLTTSKFHDGEVNEEQKKQMKEFFRNALLAVIAPCGLLFTHGSPDDTLKDIEHLNNINFVPATMTPTMIKF